MNAAFRITDAMLVAAVDIDDLDEALRSVMDQVGIDDGGVAGIVFCGRFEEDWPTASRDYRLTMLQHWREAEQVHNLAYPLNPPGELS